MLQKGFPRCNILINETENSAKLLIFMLPIQTLHTPRPKRAKALLGAWLGYTLFAFLVVSFSAYSQQLRPVVDSVVSDPAVDPVVKDIEKLLDKITQSTDELRREANRIKALQEQVSKVELESRENMTASRKAHLNLIVNAKHTKENSKLSRGNYDRSMENFRRVNGLDGMVDLNTQGILAQEHSLAEIRNGVSGVSELHNENRRDYLQLRDQSGLNKSHLNRFWMLLAALLVFLMQAGFKVYEAGLVRIHDKNSVGIKNLLDWLVVALVFYIVGFGIMFGPSAGGAFGFGFFGAAGIEESDHELGYEFFLFHIAFAATAVTIVSGALAVRTMLFTYLILAAMVGGIIYPLFGHWVWGDFFLPENEPWLAKLGFLDFAGGTIVHSVGAWIALVGAFFVRPRLGKYFDRESGEIRLRNPEHFRPHDLSYSVLGLFILWVGWWGFTGGIEVFVTIDETNVFTNTRVPAIILNTALAGAASGLVAFFHCYYFQHRRNLYEKLLGGTLGGLVAITACGDVVNPDVAVFVVGAFAGLMHNEVYDLINRRRLFGRIIDDPVGAIAIHGPCGVWGTLCVALGDHEKIKKALGDFYPEDWSRLGQLGDQVTGVVVCFIFTVSASALLFTLLSKTIGLEVSPEQEKQGDIIGLRDEEKASNIGLTGLPPETGAVLK